MKNLSVLLTLFLCLHLIGCRTSDEALLATSQNSIGHSWSLNRVSGGLAGINITYPYGEVTWYFNETTNELSVQNNIMTTGPEDIYAGHETGIYPYQIVVTNGDSVLFIDNLERGIISIVNNNLQIDDGVVVDGMLTEFEQINP